MNNLTKSMKKIIGNKNKVTIIGVVLSVIILYIGYNYRIDQQVKLTRVPYANQTIQPKTKITADMIEYMNVPASFLKGTPLTYCSPNARLLEYSENKVVS